jgi:hypothetical protein
MLLSCSLSLPFKSDQLNRFLVLLGLLLLHQHSRTFRLPYTSSIPLRILGSLSDLHTQACSLALQLELFIL